MSDFTLWLIMRLKLRAAPVLARHPRIKRLLLSVIRRNPLALPIVTLPVARPAATKHGISLAAQRVRESGLFDEAFYIGQSPFVRNLDPVEHYLAAGAMQYLEPSPTLSMRAYLAENPDVRESSGNPLLHYLDWGRVEDRDIHTNVEDASWKNWGQALPDDTIHFEQMAGVAYFSHYGFSFEGTSETKWIPEAIEGLAIQSPRLALERLAPDVTIIIPVYGQMPFVLGCLDSLAKHESKYSVEIIVCDDASPEANECERLHTIPWIRYLRRPTNGGFLDACNWAADRARGGHLVFLNSDTRVAKSWLDELIGSFDIFPRAGLVGSKLFNDDLSLQEAGGIIWRDGSAWNYGRNDDANHPRYCFARQVDYCSGAAIAVPTNLWRHIGGFDPEYRPAYCEDVDFAFKVRAAGYETWYQPLARVIHYEGKTHGRDVTSGIKSYQVENLKRLAKRWAGALVNNGTNGVAPHDHANRGAEKRLLIIDSMNPAPDIDSGSVVTMQMIRSYQELGYQVTFLSQETYRFDPRFGPSLQRSGVECLYSPFFSEISDVLDVRTNYDLVLVYRVTTAINVFDSLRSRLPLAPIMFHNIDLHYLREMREARLKNSELGMLRAMETQRLELGIIARADCAIVTSSAETTEIQSQMPRPLNTILEMPICVEVETSEKSFAERRDIMFLAGFAHPPNIDAAEFLVREIWPLLVNRLPQDARLLITGSNPTDAVKALADERVIVTGFVPELQPWFDKARVFTAPLRYGAGVKGKVIQSLAHGTPSVITTIAAEGIGLKNGVQTLIADQPEQLADAILSLYFDEGKWTDMQRAAYAHVAEHFSRETGTHCCKQAADIANATWMKRRKLQLQRELNSILDDEDKRNPHSVAV